METKCIEIRDEGTCIPAMAFKMAAGDPVEDRFFWRCGYPRDGSTVILMELNRQKATSDPYEHFDEIPNGGVVDVRVILGENDTPATREIHTAL